jgi:hypothetical protein
MANEVKVNRHVDLHGAFKADIYFLCIWFFILIRGNSRLKMKSIYPKREEDTTNASNSGIEKIKTIT